MKDLTREKHQNDTEMNAIKLSCVERNILISCYTGLYR